MNFFLLFNLKKTPVKNKTTEQTKMKNRGNYSIMSSSSPLMILEYEDWLICFILDSFS